MPSPALNEGACAAADGVGPLDDHAVGGLAEDVGQPRHRHASEATSSANGLPAPTGAS